jgi:WD40 repeat protein
MTYLRAGLLLLLWGGAAAAAAPPGWRWDFQCDPLPPGAVGRVNAAPWGGYRPGDAFAFSPDGRWAAARIGEQIRVWSRRTGGLARVLTQPVVPPVIGGLGGNLGHRVGSVATGWAFLPDSKGIVSASTRENALVVHDLEKGTARVLPVEGVRDGCALVVCPGGRRAAFPAFPETEGVRVVDLVTGRVRRLEWPGAVVHQVVFARGDRLAVVAEQDGDRFVRLMDLDGGHARTVPLGPCNAALLSPDGRFVLLLDGDFNDEGVIVQPLVGRKRRRMLCFNPEHRTTLRFTEGGKTLAVLNDGKAAFHDLATGRCLRRVRVEGLVMGVDAPSLSEDGATLALGGDDLRLWDTRTGRLLHTRSGKSKQAFEALAFSRDGRSLVGVRGPLVRRWDLATGRARTRTPTGDGDPDEKKRWRLGPFGERGLLLDGSGMRWYDLRTGKLLSTFPLHADESLIVQTDGRLLAVGSVLGTIRLWDLASGRRTHTINYGDSPSLSAWLALSPDGKLLAAEGEGDKARFYDTRTGRLRFVRRAEAAKEPTLDALIKPAWGGFSPDGERLYVSDSGGLRVWNVREASVPPGFEHHTAVAQNNPALSPDGRLLLRATDGNELWLSETASGRVVFRTRGTVPVAFSPDGRRLAATNPDDGSILLWDLRRLVLAGAPPAGLVALWAKLGEPTAEGWRAAWQLSTLPGVERFLAGKLRPVEPPTAAMKKWLAELGSDRYAVREEASRGLAGAGEAAGPLIRDALRQANDLEVHRRLERLVAALSQLHPERLREARGVLALELCGTVEAAAVLRRLAKGSPAMITREAKAALVRWEIREK